MSRRLLRILATGMICGICLSLAQVSAQKADTSRARVSEFSARVQHAVRRVSEESQRKYAEETVAAGQQRTLDNIEREIQSTKLFLRSQLDTTSIVTEMARASASFAVVKEGVAAGKGEIQTHRNLTVSSAILTQLLKDMSERKSQVDRMTGRLVQHRYKLDSMSADTMLYTLSSDSVKIMAYMEKLRLLNLSIGPVDSLIDRSIGRLQGIQAGLAPLVFELNLTLEGLEAEKERLSTLVFRRETGSIWELTGNRPISDILRLSLAKEKMAFEFYVSNYSGRFLVLCAALMISTFFLRSLRQRYRERTPQQEAERGNPLVLRRPLVSSLLIVPSLFQFIFIDPPFIISFSLWLVSIVGLTILFSGYITRYWLFFWLNVTGLFLLACVCNMILQPSGFERWTMLLLAIAGVLHGSYIVRSKYRDELKEDYILYAVRFMVLLEAASALANLYGRYNLAKTLMMSGFVGLVIAILFLWAVRLIDESLRLSNSLYKSPDRKLFYVNFNKVGNKAPLFLYVLLGFGWLILVGRNYYEFRQIIKPFNMYITETRTIGDYDFTIRDLLLFVGISGASVVVSRIVSFFATEPGIHATDGPQRASSIAANWLLLIRILLITSGILLAFAASGIALDRLTIVIGALGVGIGLGLQSLVTNLVSGLIIAFERPVSVGDQVEVNGKMGTMKSVGFRSSIISLVDGACMIVPNGDLLSQHLINWTMGKDKRRLSITVGVAYGTDLAMAKGILLEMLGENENIAMRPQAMVIAKEFNASSIDLELIFWVRSLDLSLTVRDQVIGQIDLLFRKHGIVIPFPQHDVNIIKAGGAA